VRVNVTIVVNGERREVPESLTVAGLLRDLGVKPEYVAVEVNRDLVPRARHDRTRSPRTTSWRWSPWSAAAPRAPELEPIVIGRIRSGVACWSARASTRPWN
jgi:thiamine biosynthesis protein ThiS